LADDTSVNVRKSYQLALLRVAKEVVYIGTADNTVAAYVSWAPGGLSRLDFCFNLGAGRRGTKIGEFRQPLGLARHKTEIFVADSENHRIQVFDLLGKFLRCFGKKGELPGDFNRPASVGICRGKVVVSEFSGRRMQVSIYVLLREASSANGGGSWPQLRCGAQLPTEPCSCNPCQGPRLRWHSVATHPGFASQLDCTPHGADIELPG